MIFITFFDSKLALLAKGSPQTHIANVIGKYKFVISIEISRNKYMRNGKYKSSLAQKKIEQRTKEKPKKIKFTKEVKAIVNHLLKKDYSPE